MKRNFLTKSALLLCCSLFLTGCTSPTNQPDNPPTPSPVQTEAPTNAPASPTPTDIPPTQAPTLSLVLEDVYQACMAYQTANSGTEAPFMFPSDFSDPYWEDAYPGLPSIEFKQAVLYIPPIVTFACEVVLLEVNNESDLKTVKDILEKRIELGATSASCDPETNLLWQTNARIYQEGNYIGMIVLPSDYIIFEQIFSEIK